MNVQAATDAYRADADFAATANQKMQEMLARSATDMGFRAKLIAEPRAAVADFLGRDVDALGTFPNVRFVENKATATIVLPEFVDAEAELSEADLQTVAGGATPIVLSVLVVVSALSQAYMQGYSDGHSHNR